MAAVTGAVEQYLSPLNRRSDNATNVRVGLPPIRIAPTPGEVGVFILRISDYAHYLGTFRPVQLRDKITSSGIDPSSPVNFGESKGRGFDHVVILPTGPMRKWLADE